jgi:hypothetical protein
MMCVVCNVLGYCIANQPNREVVLTVAVAEPAFNLTDLVLYTKTVPELSHLAPHFSVTTFLM